jgi:hypothetical protein
VQAYTLKKAPQFHITLTAMQRMHLGQEQALQTYYMLYKHCLELRHTVHITPAGTVQEAADVITCKAVTRSYHMVFQVALHSHVVMYEITE